MLLNGSLHDIFVMISDHGKKYDRDLLRPLMDGHILITCGAMQTVGFRGLEAKGQWAYFVAGIPCLSLLIHGAMIFPFLKSIVTITMNAFLIVLLVARFFSLK